ncbi:MAG: carboxypeptidase M32, partial [Coriobacteriales bacterium]|nr:carboxypeptidase M32 [Coriobacteriales bacterium]
DLAHLKAVERHLFAHRYASAELESFGATIDPKKATEDRAEALAVLMEEDHDLLGKPEVGAMLNRLGTKSAELDKTVAAEVRVLTRDRDRLVNVPAADQAKLVRLTAQSYDAWLAAKANDDWRSFAPYLDRLVSLQRRIALAKNPDAHPYDTLLDEYEQGTNRAFYNTFFARVKRCVLPLLTSISNSGRTLSSACVEGRFDVGRQWELARDIAHLEGIDEDAHYLTSTEHPFSEALTSNYAITAAHVEHDDLMSNVYTMLHEVGHNLYEQGVNPDFNRTVLKGGTSMGMHEAQSRFFENYVGKDRAFMGPLLELMKQRFRGQLSRVTPNQLYLAVNRVSPTPIRTNADELTYPLHILVRYEIEQLLFEGKATAREIPKLWDERYRKYIGTSTANYTEGPLQDVHWAQGCFGYFPTYALGGAYAAQFRAKMIDEGLAWDELLAAGDLAPIRAWLRDHVWQYGRAKDPAQIMQDACGEPFNPRHYANYLTKKYAALYGIR